jgi:phenylacetate-CoA ligase
MTSVYDALETRTPAQREDALLASLPGQVAHAQSRSAAFSRILSGIDASAITSRAALATLPVTRKHELQEIQQASRAQGSAGNVFGGFSAIGFGPDMPRVFASPGPIYEPEGSTSGLLAHGAGDFRGRFQAG